VGFDNVVSRNSKVNVASSNEVMVQSNVIFEIRRRNGGKRKQDRGRGYLLFKPF
jgi:hypothetical protein